MRGDDTWLVGYRIKTYVGSVGYWACRGILVPAVVWCARPLDWQAGWNKKRCCSLCFWIALTQDGSSKYDELHFRMLCPVSLVGAIIGRVRVFLSC